MVIEIPEDVVVEFEWVEEGRRFREFLVPAEIVNRYPRRLVDDGDFDPIELSS